MSGSWMTRDGRGAPSARAVVRFTSHPGVWYPHELHSSDIRPCSKCRSASCPRRPQKSWCRPRAARATARHAGPAAPIHRWPDFVSISELLRRAFSGSERLFASAHRRDGPAFSKEMPAAGVRCWRCCRPFEYVRPQSVRGPTPHPGQTVAATAGTGSMIVRAAERGLRTRHWRGVHRADA